MAVDCCYISAFTIGDSSACAAPLGEIIPHVLLVAVSPFEHIPAASQRCSTSHWLPSAELVKHILQEIRFVCETCLFLSAPFKAVLGLSEQL